MKTVFYKKVLPIALVASLAVSGIAGAYSVSAAPAVQSAVVSSVPVVGAEPAATDLTIGRYTEPGEIKFDYLDDDSVEANFTLNFTGLKESFSSADLVFSKFKISIDGTTPYNGLTLTELSKVSDISDSPSFSNYALKGKITSYAQTTSGLKLYYGDTALTVSEKRDAVGEEPAILDSFTITVTREAAANKTILSDSDKAVGYKGASKRVDLSKLTSEKASVVEIAANGFKNNKNVQSVSIPAQITKVNAGAFSGCKNLIMLDVAGIRAGDLTFDEAAFTNVNTALIIKVPDAATAGKVKVNSKYKNVITMVTPGESDTSNDEKATLGAGSSLAIFVDQKKVVNSSGQVIGKLTTYTDNTANKTLNIDSLGREDRENIEWGVYKPGTTSATTAGRVFKDGSYTGAKFKTGSDLITFGNLRASGALDGAAEIRATLTKKAENNSYVTYTLAKFDLNVEPEFVTAYTDLTAKVKSPKTWPDVYSKTNQYELSENKSEAASADNVDYEYDLTIYEGVSYKLPFAAANGQNRTLAYEVQKSNTTPYNSTASGFTVVNGVVRALPGGAKLDASGNAVPVGSIEVTPVDQMGRENNTSPRIKVNVIVKPNVKALRANTTSLTLIPGVTDPQRFTVSANPVSTGEISADITFPENYDVKPAGGSALTIGDHVTIKENQEFEVTASAGAAKGKIVFKYHPTTAKDGVFKYLNINVAPSKTGVYDNVKSVKTTGKVNKSGVIELYVPKNTPYNLGVSVIPVTADNNICWHISNGGSSLDSNVGNYISGDVFQTNLCSTFDVWAESTGHDMTDHPVLSNTYKIHVYDPGASIVWKDSTYILRGGVMVAKADPSSNTITVGDKITINAPELTGTSSESITWKSSNPGSMYVDTATAGKLDIYATVAGTYNVTGISDITKQKFVFKVIVGDNLTTANKTSLALNVTKDDTITLTAGTTQQVYVASAGASAKRVTWEVASGDRQYVTVSNGLITARKATTGDGVTVTAKLSNDKTGEDKVEESISFKVKVTAAAPVINITKAPQFAELGKPIKGLAATAVNVTNRTPVWKFEKVDDSSKKGDVSATAGISGDGITAGKYKIYPVYDGTANNDGAVSRTIEVYDHVATGVTVFDPVGFNKIADLKGKNPGQGIGNMNINAEGIDLTSSTPVTVYIPLKLIYNKAGDAAGTSSITWTSSNANIANAKDMASVAESYQVAGANRYVEITINKNGKTGMVTLTGVTLNGGKKVNITLNVVEGDKKIKEAQFNPSKISAFTTKSISAAFKESDTVKEFLVKGVYTPADATEANNLLYTNIPGGLKGNNLFAGDTAAAGVSITDIYWDKAAYVPTTTKNGTTTVNARPFTMKVTVTKSTALNGKNTVLTLKESTNSSAGTFKLTVSGAQDPPSGE